MDRIRCLVQGRFDPDNFTQEVADVAQKLVPLTVTLWNKVSAKMLPTPAKFHYLFNMRELSKVSCSSISLACQSPAGQTVAKHMQCDMHYQALQMVIGKSGMCTRHDADCASCDSGVPRCDLGIT